MNESKVPAPPPQIPDHTLIRPIGRGAYGEVWLAQNVMGGWRAVKLVRRDHFSSSRPYEREFEGIRRFEPLSRAHESQVDILHVGRDDQAGLFFYIMELADDENSAQVIDPGTYSPRTLASELHRHQRLPPRRCLEIGLGLATALNQIHAHGLIHRDIKPSNIIFVHGRAKLADIGLVADAAASVSFVGTEGYVPMEGPGSTRADIFSLGRVLYEISTGFSQRQFPDIPSSFGLDEEDGDLSRELNLIVNKACAHRAEHRHADAASLHEELLLLHSGHSIRRLRENERRVRLLGWFGAAAAVVALFAAVGYFSARRANARADDQTREAQASERRANEQARRANERLVDARVAQAQALRSTADASQRAAALAAVTEAAAVKPSRMQRDEIIALSTLMTLTDVHVVEAPEFHPGLDNPFLARLTTDGKLLATRLSTGVIAITEASTGIRRASLSSANRNTIGLAWSPDTKTLAVTNEGGTQFWDWASQHLIAERPTDLPNPEAMGCPVTFSADGTRVAFRVRGKIEVMELPTGKTLVSVLLPCNANGFALHPNRPWLVVGDRQNIQVWDYEKQTAHSQFASTGEVCAMAWSPDGTTLGAVHADGSLSLHNVETHVSVWRQRHRARPNMITFSPDGSLVATTAVDETFILWNAYTGALMLSEDGASATDFSADGTSLFLRTGWEVRVTKLGKPSEFFHTFPLPLGAQGFGLTAWSPDGGKLAALAENGQTLRIWSRAKSWARQDLSLPTAGIEAKAIALAADGKSVMLSEKSGSLRFPVIVNGEKAELGPPQPEERPPAPLDTSLSPDGKWRAQFSRDKCEIFDVKTGDIVRTLPRHRYEEMRARAVFSPDGRILACLHNRNHLQLIAVPSWEVLAVMEPPNGSTAEDVGFSPDGTLLTLWNRNEFFTYELPAMRKALARFNLNWDEKHPVLPGDQPSDVGSYSAQFHSTHLEPRPPAPPAATGFGAPRLVPGTERRVVEFTDQDGDVIRVAISHGQWGGPEGGTPESTQIIAHPVGRGFHLDAIVLTGSAASEAPQDLIVTAKSGEAEIGIIESRADLRLVKIEGDLTEISVGDLNDGALSLERLEVHSLGRINTKSPSLQNGWPASNESLLRGSVAGGIFVRENIYGSYVQVQQVNGSGGDLRLLQIGELRPDGTMTPGSLLGGSSEGAGCVEVFGNTDLVRIGGDVQGAGGAQSGMLRLRGDAREVDIRGSLIGGTATRLMVASGGVEVGMNRKNKAGNLGNITVGGDLRGGSGRGTALISSKGQIGSAIVKGTLRGGSADSMNATIQARGDVGHVEVGEVIGTGRGSAEIVSAEGKLSSVRIERSMLGGPGLASGIIWAYRGIGQVSIGQDLVGGAGDESGSIRSSNGGIEGITIEGQIRGGTGKKACEILAGVGNLGYLRVKGSVLMTEPGRPVIVATGHEGGRHEAIGEVSIGGDAAIDICAACDKSGLGGIGKIKVGGNWTSGCILANMNTHENPDHSWGTAADSWALPSSASEVARIEEITISGSVIPPPAPLERYFSAPEIGKLRVGGTLLPTNGAILGTLEDTGRMKYRTQR